MVSGLGSQTRCCHQTPVYGIRVHVVHVGLADSCHHSNDTPNTPVPNTMINGSRMVRMDKDRALTGGWVLDLTDC